MTIQRCIGFCLLAVVLAFATVQFWISALIYRPAPLYQTEPRSWGLKGAVPMQVAYGDGTAITGWWQRSAQDKDPVVLLVHGRSANISSHRSIMQHLVADGMGVLMFDYRGYGASPGRPSERNISQDTLTAYHWWRAQGVEAKRIVVVGQSLGNAPATALAARQHVGGLLLVSPFTRLPDALAERLSWLPVKLIP